MAFRVFSRAPQPPKVGPKIRAKVIRLKLLIFKLSAAPNLGTRIRYLKGIKGNPKKWGSPEGGDHGAHVEVNFEESDAEQLIS